jgi:hypothetical protein
LRNTFSMPNTTITSAETVPAGTFSPVDPGPRATPVTGLPSFCRVIDRLTPTSDSQIGIEIWMPTTGWNGKYQSIGNHNLGGVIYYGDMGLQLIRNYAVASSDTGHIGNEAQWGAGHPEKVADFGWRAVHQLTVTAKAVIAASIAPIRGIRISTAARWAVRRRCRKRSGSRTTTTESFRPGDEQLDAIASGAHLAAGLAKDGVDGAHYIPPSKTS